MKREARPAIDDRPITDLLREWSEGDAVALERLTSLVYEDLRWRAAARLRRSPSLSEIQTTEVVHEAFLRLLRQDRYAWTNRGQFFAIATLMIRRVVVDEARHRLYAKRQGRTAGVPLDEVAVPRERDAERILAVNEAIADLGRENPELARIVELRFFAGLTSKEIGRALGLSVPTVTRRWRLARAWLGRRLASHEREPI